MTDYILVDLDGTLANTTYRRQLLDKGREGGPDWRAYSLACADDPPIPEMLWLVRALRCRGHIVIMSGRDEAARQLTEHWLDEHGVTYHRLLMRAEGDRTKNVDLKLRWIDQLAEEGHRIRFAIDNFPAVLSAIEEKWDVSTLLAWSNGRRFDIVELERANRLGGDVTDTDVSGIAYSLGSDRIAAIGYCQEGTMPKCGATFDRGAGERPRRIECRLDAGHGGTHFATWGGSQKWRSMNWDNDGPVDDRPGRPAVGPLVNVRLPEWVIEALDQAAAQSGITRAVLVRHALEDIAEDWKRNGLAGR